MTLNETLSPVGQTLLVRKNYFSNQQSKTLLVRKPTNSKKQRFYPLLSVGQKIPIKQSNISDQLDFVGVFGTFEHLLPACLLLVRMGYCKYPFCTTQQAVQCAHRNCHQKPAESQVSHLGGL